jgi:mannose-6-phosphate isomerase-like protein (cupin superfamily)
MPNPLPLAALLATVVAVSAPRIEPPQPPAAQTPAQPKPGAEPPGAPKPGADKPAGTKPRPSQAARGAAGLTVSVQATDMSGNPIADVTVGASGPVDRSAATGADGSAVFRAMRAGTYRLRFEREGFVTLERELAVRAGQPADVSVALNAAPAKPVPAPASEPPAPAPVPPPRTDRVVEPRSLSLPDFLDQNLIGGEPQRTTLLACAQGGSGRLLQVREPLTEQQHADADEMLYVVAGTGVIQIRTQAIQARPGHFALVPRGVPHSIRRQGRNPIILLSVLAGPECVDALK